MSNQPKVTSRAKTGGGRFLELYELTWSDSQGKARKWESAERVGDQSAVVIVGILEPSDRVILIKQFRPPAGGVVLEYPAGLIDDGETPADAATRELAEETGFVGRVTHVSDFAYSSPGLTSERVALVEVAIDEARPENANPNASPDDGESIEVLIVPRRELLAFCESQVATGVKLDSKVAAYATAVGR